MRVSEFIHMRRGWIDWKMQWIRIPKMQKCRCKECEREFKIMRGKRKGEVTKPSGVWKPKTFESVRSIPIVPEAEQILKKFFAKHKKIMDIIPSMGAAYYRIRRIARRARIEHPVFPHAARGTFATLPARKQFNAFELTSTMGGNPSRQLKITSNSPAQRLNRLLKKSGEEGFN